MLWKICQSRYPGLLLGALASDITKPSKVLYWIYSISRWYVFWGLETNLTNQYSMSQIKLECHFAHVKGLSTYPWSTQSHTKLLTQSWRQSQSMTHTVTDTQSLTQCHRQLGFLICYVKIWATVAGGRCWGKPNGPHSTNPLQLPKIKRLSPLRHNVIPLIHWPYRGFTGQHWCVFTATYHGAKNRNDHITIWTIHDGVMTWKHFPNY